MRRLKLFLLRVIADHVPCPTCGKIMPSTSVATHHDEEGY